jgi:WD40 repeat protein
MTHDTGVAAMSFAVSRAALTTMSSGGIVHDWDPAGRLEVASARVSGSVQSLAFTKGSQYLIATDDNGPAKVQKIGGAGPSKPAEACAVVEGREGLSTSETSAAGVLVRNWRTGASFALEVDAPAAVPRSYRERPPSGCTANRQVFSPDGSHLAVRQSSGRLFVWNLRNQGRRDYTTPADLRDVFAFGPDGRVLALAAAPQEVRLVDADSGSEKARWTLDEPVETLTFTSEGRHLAIASRRAIQIFDTRTHAALGRIAREGWEFEPRFSPDGRYLATDGGHNSDAVDRRVIAQGAILTRLPDGRHVADLSHSGSEVNVVAFSADSTMVATGGSDNMVHLWRTSDGKEIAAWTVGRRVGAVAFSPDGTLLAAGGEDQLARVWSVASFGEVARLDHASTVYGLAFSADNRFLATAARIAPQGEDQAHVFYLRPEDTAREICGRITRGLTSREWSESLAGEKFEATCKREAKK